MKSKLIHHSIASSYKNHTHLSILKNKIIYPSPTNIINICTINNNNTINHHDNHNHQLYIETTLHSLFNNKDVNARITCICTVECECECNFNTIDFIIVGYSNGFIISWYNDNSNTDDNEWKEYCIYKPTTENKDISIIDINGIYHDTNLIIGATISSSCNNNTTTHISSINIQTLEQSIIPTTKNLPKNQSLDTILFFHNTSSSEEEKELMLCIGTASHASNSILLFSFCNENENNASFAYVGKLLGHSNWITCLCYNSSENVLASGSMDCTIRLWKFTYTANATAIITNETGVDDEIDNDDEHLIVEDDEEEDIPRVSYNNTNIYLSALLVGHEDTITQIKWNSSYTSTLLDDNSNKISLLSSSMDKSIFLWYPDTEQQEQEQDDTNTNNCWIPQIRIGTLNAGIDGGSIGSTILGYTSIVSYENKYIIATSYGGSISIYDYNTYTNLSITTGHFNMVTDISFASFYNKYYLLSVSLDQTCRLWVPVPSSSASASPTINTKTKIWKEVGRPQIHGYNLNCIESLNNNTIISGGDEKVIRYFEAPTSTINLLSTIYSINNQNDNEDEVIRNNMNKNRSQRGYIPSLGLSNKDYINSDISITNTSTTSSNDKVIVLPLENEICTITVWPEKDKLYGHDTEVICLCYCDMLNIIASTSKARDADNAFIRLWYYNIHDNDTDTNDTDNMMVHDNNNSWELIDVLKYGHQSTIVTMSFTKCGNYLASSGKDRRICLWKKDENQHDEIKFTLVHCVTSAHKRIIWSIDFIQQSQTTYMNNISLASGSRDGYVKIWNINNNDNLEQKYMFEPMHKKGKTCSITSLSFAPIRVVQSTNNNDDYYVLAIGLENGSIEIWNINYTTKPIFLYKIKDMDCHTNTISKILWKPYNKNDDDDDKLILASCSYDYGVRIFEIDLFDDVNKTDNNDEICLTIIPLE